MHGCAAGFGGVFVFDVQRPCLRRWLGAYVDSGGSGDPVIVRPAACHHIETSVGVGIGIGSDVE